MSSVTWREHRLAELVFGAHLIAEAKRATFPAQRLLELKASSPVTGAYSGSAPLFENVHGWALEGTRVRFCGLSHDDLIFETTLAGLAEIAVAGLYQESFLELLK